MKIGFIGLGNLGFVIAENLLATRQPLYVYNRTAAKAQPLIEKGAISCTSVKELSAQCDIVFSIVSDDAALKEITDGPDGIAAHLKKEGIHVSMSTILPVTATTLTAVHRQQGNIYIACPLLARPDAAKARKINFLVAGEEQAIKTIKPLLQEAGGINVWEYGREESAANVAKLASNYLILTAMSALSESINMTKRSNIEVDTWFNMITQTIFNAPVYINYGKHILSEAFQPALFGLSLGLKDMNLVLEQAATVKAAMPLGAEVRSLLQESKDAGLGDHDVTAVALTIQQKQ
ncbi:NAD(P)-dependent oxidoreductase [Chitinophaga pendula]|uniref:NAD(P)-dependent oxidoreductase n=1 Tax=Chitinophaga TaxID=79328 RepID=UPI0018E00BA5|nr:MULTISPECIES: NAD(P)-dependent oxidoreductase [Chitinophaga]UCJ09595.1 NAD(P)-dependent oxidoreductase [Chitinophaga pendula]